MGQSSSEDMKRYYDLHDDTSQNPMRSPDRKSALSRCQQEKGRGQSGESGEGVRGDVFCEEERVTESNEDGVCDGGDSGDGASGSDGESDSSTDVEDVLALRDPEVGGVWVWWVWSHWCDVV